jgi:hypothetical protein
VGVFEGHEADNYRDVVLPVAALLKQYKDNPESSIIRHFDLLFIQQSIGKLSSLVSFPNSTQTEALLTMCRSK